jgi:S-DNA-T family DNA segregation ATPase FtsK/SpoIIIE
MPRKRRFRVEEPSNPDLFDWLQRIQNHFGRFAFDIGGVILFAFALMTLLALLGWTGGSLLTPWSFTLWRWLGYGSVFMVIAAGIGGLTLMRKPREGQKTIHWWRVVTFELAAFFTLTLLAIIGGTSVERAEAGLDGGYTGWALAQLLSRIIPSEVAQIIIVVVGLIIFIILGFGLLPVFENILWKIAGEAPKPDAVEPEIISETRIHPIAEPIPAPTRTSPPKIPAPLPPEFRKNFKVSETKDEKPASPKPRSENLPPFSMLIGEQTTRPDEHTINMTAGLIEKTLSEFGIPAKVVGFRIGPTVTQFAVQPGFIKKPGSNENDAVQMKVRVAQIAALQKDLALAISAHRLRIEAPVPGRAYVGIEVPNAHSSLVRLRPILESEAFSKVNAPLAIALGRDVSGLPLVADLGRMPHMLVAGQTGSGKSVFIAALAACLAINNEPEDLRLVMIDVKMVELLRFNGLRHLLGKVETDAQRILGVLRWLVVEMEHRYRLLESVHARDIEAYNRKSKNSIPRIVVIIDELADLMMSAPDQTEHHLVRLAQMARATGIHLVVATQRPSTDVVTGLIKANFPARLAFSVASGIDSRVILDSTGAESLLGRGDMLFLNPEVGSPIRAQGVWVTDQEIERVIAFWKPNAQTVGQKNSMEVNNVAPWESLLSEPEEGSEDAMVEQAIEVVRSSQRASASLLQRRLKLGYPRAARLLDQLEEMGVVGPSQGGGRERDVLIEPGEDEVPNELDE